MRVIRACGVCALVVLMAGCPAEKSGKDGKPKSAAGRFLIEGLPESVTVLNGNEKTLEATLVWKTDPREEVALTVRVEPAGQGVTATVKPTTAKAVASQPVKVTVVVSEGAADGDYKVKLIGKAPEAGEVSQNTTVIVPKKE